jgi:Putative endonuclease, protein of unknown function (DUF1780)
MSDDELLASIKKSRIEMHEFWSNANKSERELFCVALFLELAGIDHSEDELIPQNVHSKTDIQFRNFSFQVKEIMDKDRDRSGNAKRLRKNAESAKSLKDLICTSRSFDVPVCTTMIECVIEALETLADKSYTAEQRQSLDLLFYVTRTYAGIFSQQQIESIDLSNFGWRSISAVHEKQAVVLYASQTSPEYLQKLRGIISTPKIEIVAATVMSR